MKHISKVNVYGKQHLSQKEINDCTNQDNSKIYCNKHKRKFTPQNNIHQFAKVYYIDKNSFELVNNRSESYEIIHWYYNINELYNEEMHSKCNKEIPPPQKNVKVNEFEIKLIKSRKPRKDEIINVKYKYLYKDVNNKDKAINNLKIIKPISEERESIIKPKKKNKEIKKVKAVHKDEAEKENVVDVKEEVIQNKKESNVENNCKHNNKKDKQVQMYQSEILHISACNHNNINKLQQLNEKMFHKDIDLNIKAIQKDLLNINNTNNKGIPKIKIKSKKHHHHNKKQKHTKYCHSTSTFNINNNNDTKELKIKESKHNCPCHRILDPSMYLNYHPKNISINLDYYHNRTHFQNQTYQVAVKIPKNIMQSLNYNFIKSSPNFSKSLEK
jgi:hypothetical protein